MEDQTIVDGEFSMKRKYNWTGQITIYDGNIPDVLSGKAKPSKETIVKKIKNRFRFILYQKLINCLN
jgi:hypothetical protein